MEKINFEENVSLKKYNTFRVDVKALFLADGADENNILAIINDARFKNLPKLILGEGSNILFTKDFNGIVIRPTILGKRIIREDPDSIMLEVGAGENWHKLVAYAVDRNWGGIENLALIPGTVGAAPVQNIAAYGQNFSDVFDSLEALDLESGTVKKFKFEDCEFGYRDSVFKESKGKYLVLRVMLRLSKNPELETSYYQIGISHNSIKIELEKIAAKPYTIRDAYNAIVNIRTRKLPDIAVIPNMGSFFLNPTVSRIKYEELKNADPELQCYPLAQLSYKSQTDSALNEEPFVKVAAGRMLEKLGWLGRWKGNCGVHDKHALIVVTNGRAGGKEILDFSEDIKKDFLNHYGIELKTEINII